VRNLGGIMLKKINYKKSTYHTLSLIVISLLPVFLDGSAAHARLIQYIDFETGDLSQFNGSISKYDGLDYISAVNNKHRAGQYAAKCHFETGEDRVEITTANGINANGQYGINGQTNWYGWSMWIPTGISSDQWTILGQWHYHTPSHIVDSLEKIKGGGNSPTRLGLYPQGMLKLALFHQIGATQKTEDLYELGDNLIRYDNWNDFVMKVKWTSRTDGFMTFWVNNKQVLNLTKTSTYFDNPYGPRFKAGAYKGGNYKYPGDPFDVYIDEYRHGDQTSSYREIVPGSGAKSIGLYHQHFKKSKGQNSLPR
jgi:Polysaccharide lyase